jgi:hypothetical protein
MFGAMAATEYPTEHPGVGAAPDTTPTTLTALTALDAPAPAPSTDSVFPQMAGLTGGELLPAFDSPEWARLRSVVVAVLVTAPDTRLGEMLPTLANAHGVVTHAPAGVEALRCRSVNVLRRELGPHTLSWPALAETTPGEMARWAKCGVTTVGDILRYAVDVAARTPPVPAATVKRHGGPREVQTAGAQHRGLGADMASVYATAEDPTEASVVHEAPAETLGALIDTILGSLGPRGERIFEARLLGLPRLTLTEIGDEFSVTRERIRQLERRVECEVRTAVDSPAGTRLRFAAHVVARVAGTVVGPDDAELAALLDGLMGPGAHLARHEKFLLWLAGPYRLERGLLSSIPIADLTDHLSEHADDAGVFERPLAELLAEKGVKSRALEDVAEALGLRFRSGQWALRPHNMVDAAVAVMACSKAVHTLDELAALVGATNLRSLRQRLVDDGRVIPVGPSRFASPGPGRRPYRGIAADIVDWLALAGGRAHIEDLAQLITAERGVSASSVRTYARAPQFCVERGMVRLRAAHEALVVGANIDGLANVARDGSCIVLTVVVDNDVLRGSGRTLPRRLTAALGVGPGDRRTFGDIGGGELRLVWPTNVPSGGHLGSLRSAAERLGAAEGDELRLAFNPAEGTVNISR